MGEKFHNSVLEKKGGGGGWYGFLSTILCYNLSCFMKYCTFLTDGFI